MASFPGDKLTMEYALSFLGVPYLWGGASYDGIDCSQLVIEILKQRGLVQSNFDCTAHDLFLRTHSGGILKPEAHALVFYGSKQRATHVAYCLDERTVLESAGAGSNCTTREIAAKLGAFVRMRPIFYRRDFLGFSLADKSHFS